LREQTELLQHRDRCKTGRDEFLDERAADDTVPALVELEQTVQQTQIAVIMQRLDDPERQIVEMRFFPSGWATGDALKNW
jgi:DNA-directed RNA polymerase sigma subunit (sigma70/sigma32)